MKTNVINFKQNIRVKNMDGFYTENDKLRGETYLYIDGGLIDGIKHRVVVTQDIVDLVKSHIRKKDNKKINKCQSGQ